MYLAVMLFMASVAARSGSWLVVVECLGLIILFNIKARWEERQLDAAFPGYDRYAAMTSRFIPGFRKRSPIEGGPVFRISLMRSVEGSSHRCQQITLDSQQYPIGPCR